MLDEILRHVLNFDELSFELWLGSGTCIFPSSSGGGAGAGTGTGTGTSGG